MKGASPDLVGTGKIHPTKCFGLTPPSQPERAVRASILRRRALLQFVGARLLAFTPTTLIGTGKPGVLRSLGGRSGTCPDLVGSSDRNAAPHHTRHFERSRPTFSSLSLL